MNIERENQKYKECNLEMEAGALMLSYRAINQYLKTQVCIIMAFTSSALPIPTLKPLCLFLINMPVAWVLIIR